MQYIHSVTVFVHLVTGLRTCGDTPALCHSNLQQKKFCVFMFVFDDGKLLIS